MTLKRILTTVKTLPESIIEGDFENDLVLQNELQLLSDDVLQEDYVSDVKEYPGKIKKIFVKGESEKHVPRQVLNIVTKTFKTSPTVYFSKISVEFQEL